MKEEFLNFIWRYQYFEKQDLRSEQGQLIEVIDPGALNVNSGPDFIGARIKIGKINWAGYVEIHTRSSDWYGHNHHRDPAYDQVILHVVWSNDKMALTSNGRDIPVVVLKNRISSSLLLNHRKLEGSFNHIPCEQFTDSINQHAVRKMLERTIHQRLSRKSNFTLDLLRKNNGDWDQVAYFMFGQNFGFHINSESFSLLVRTVPLAIVRKIRSSLLQLEALYFGQAGLLSLVADDAYYKQLQEEYQYLRKKYALPTSVLKGSMWKYLRLRPSNFPGLRIAQFASFMYLQGYQFSEVRELNNPRYPVLDELTPSAYWQTHYDFGKRGGSGGKFGTSSSRSILINTVVPLLVAYAEYTGQSNYQGQAEALLKRIPAEHNRKLVYWKDTGFKVSSAWDSQALIELNNLYCENKKCMDCEIGTSLLTTSPG